MVSWLRANGKILFRGAALLLAGAAAAKDVMDLNIYGIHVAYFNSNTGDIAYPATIVPPHDDEFSDQSWPNGWKNIDPFQSYREMFDGSIIVSQNEELI